MPDPEIVEPEDNDQQDYTEPEHPEFSDVNPPAAEADPYRNPDGTFKPGHPYGWQPGQSGNPKGAALEPKPKEPTEPKGKRLSDVLKFFLNKRCTFRGYKSIKWDQALIKRCLEWIMEKGNPSLIKEIFDRVEGTVAQIHEVETIGKTVLVISEAEPPGDHNPAEQIDKALNGHSNKSPVEREVDDGN